MSRLLTVIFCFVVFVFSVTCDYQVTIYPTYLSQNDKTHYETQRWNGHNELDYPGYIPALKAMGTKTSRWLNIDVSFRDVTQDPHHHGYPDPNYFKNTAHFKGGFDKYIGNFRGYGNDTCIIVETKGIFWPNWLDRSHYNGKFPNNLDAGAEFIVLYLQALKQYTNGIVPTYFEVMNEPGVWWKDISWQAIIDYHRVVSSKLKAHFPGMKVGGPTRNGVTSIADRNNFREWKLDASYLDMALNNNLDFYSFHEYANLDSNGVWSGASESRLVAYIDLIENYAYQKKGHGIPLIVSEFGAFEGNGIDSNKPNPYVDWIHIYGHISQMYTFLNFRNVIDQAVGFFLYRTEYEGQKSLHYSLLNKDGSEANGAKAYRFWKQFNYGYQFLRVDSPFDNHERMISSLAMANSGTGQMAVLLHSHEMSHATRVKLNFDHNWLTPDHASSTCLYLNSNNGPSLDAWKWTAVNNGYVTVPAKSSCIFTFNTHYNFHNIHVAKETTYYGQDTIKPIKKDCKVCIISCSSCVYAVSTHVNIQTTSNIQYALLRIAVSLPGNSGGNPTPKTVLVNNHQVRSYYQLHQTSRGHGSTRWEVYVYNVPQNNLVGNNEIKVEFNQASGYVSTVALVIGRN